jgi:RNA polymerase sigma factor (TIGR02999 family)
MAHERAGQTIQPTELVHMAYLRLVSQDPKKNWDSPGHFFAAANIAMRRILIERIRKKQSRKNGAGFGRCSLNEAELRAAESDDEALNDPLLLDKALNELAALDEQMANLVRFLYFGDKTIAEASRLLGLSVRTANRRWQYARAWLRDRINRYRSNPHPV